MKRRNAEVSILTARASHSTARSNSLERRTNHRPAKSTSRAGGERSKARPRRPPKPPESIRDTKERNTGPTSKYKKPNRYRAPIPSYLTGETDDEHQDQNSVPAKDCIVCTNTRSLHHFPTRPPTSQCTHKANICRRCLKGWIKSEFERKVWNQINCPECAARIEYDDMLEFAPRNIFHRYDKLSTKAALEAIPGFQWCPAQNCTSGQIHGDSETNPKFECLGCKYTHCLIHNVPWHRKETCAQYDYRRTDSKVRRAEEEASAKVIKATAKKCPGCKAWIQKHYGCDHMTCSKCKHEFCWLCLADWAPVSNQGPSSHRPNCALYMDR
ncbi:hypothetical protein GQ43DRAFT_367585 [Delitschia confertaspora ATCC 74209]|uniref:RBR-type E3 ubiquitin transferase n=1 Tax=Delitschia confertaspora ATCC 74209 TaxID=1513339 RepID=A0A9P4JRN6_9PLEO|nr:hypothetical protein GQ43DRAFT_367585 [Delitschia confertaspora ATCC 74209]